MKAVFYILFLPFCISLKERIEDNGYERLCSQEFKCECPPTKGDKFMDCIQLNIKYLPINLYFPYKIEAVSFQGNEIKSISINTFYNGHGVTSLDLSYNRLKFVASSSFIAFEKLTHLYLSHNELTSLPVNMLDGLHNLRVLDLSFNKLQNFLSDIFEDTTQLRELKLKFNPLINLDDISFEHLPLLEKLELESTGLITLPSDIFKYTPHLKSLSLASNFFQDIPTRAFQHATELHLLDISENLITEVKPNAFKELNNLTVLFMNRQRGLLAIRENAFGDMIKLRTLQCSYNSELMYIDNDAFKREGSLLPLRLEQLHLRDNALENLPEDLLSWKDVSYLDLRGNPWRCDCHLKWMANVHEQQNFQENIKCVSPSYYEDIPVSRLKVNDFSCNRYYFTDSFPVILILIMFTLVGLSSILSLIIFCSKKINRRWRATRQRRYTHIPKVERIDLEWDDSADP